jgi:hypothetical protein
MQYARRLLERYEWWRFERHPDWIEGAGDGVFRPHCAGIPGTVRIVYVPVPFYGGSRLAAITGLEEDVQYQASLYDPRTGRVTDLGPVCPESGRWVPERVGSMYRIDYVIILETSDARVESGA